MYQYDGVEGDPGQALALDHNLLEQLVRPDKQAAALDPRAIQKVERRLRGVGRPPRTATEMAEWLRRLGDLTPEDLLESMPELLQELEKENRATRIEVPGRPGPRWVLTEEEPTYRLAFGSPFSNPEAEQAAETIFGRFLATHALVSLEDIERRYPFERAWLDRMIADWTQRGELVTAQKAAADEPERWELPDTLAEVERGGLALLRREVHLQAAPFRRICSALATCHPSQGRANVRDSSWPCNVSRASRFPGKSGRMGPCQPALPVFSGAGSKS